MLDNKRHALFKWTWISLEYSPSYDMIIHYIHDAIELPIAPTGEVSQLQNYGFIICHLQFALFFYDNACKLPPE